MTTAMYVEVLPEGCTCRWLNRGDNAGWERTGWDQGCTVHGRPWPVSECSGCKARIIWTYSEASRATPVDAEPSDKGTVALSWGKVGQVDKVLSRVVTPAHLRFGRTDLRTNHFATCPAAAKFRARRAHARGGGRRG